VESRRCGETESSKYSLVLYWGLDAMIVFIQLKLCSKEILQSDSSVWSGKSSTCQALFNMFCELRPEVIVQYPANRGSRTKDAPSKLEMCEKEDEDWLRRQSEEIDALHARKRTLESTAEGIR
jgi:hypothetical protein